MEQAIIYALDFDGVLCDSAVETGITGWKAASRLWDDMQTPLPPADLIEQFRQARPIIETGYEAILAMRLLFCGDSVTKILGDFDARKRRLLTQETLDSDRLKRLFGEVRDRWIESSPEEWRGMNPLFPGVAEKLARLSENALWYIVTTKQERFVREILATNGLTLPAERIFGLDRRMNKEDVLIELCERHPQSTLHFVEDRLLTLLKILDNDRLRDVQLFFADWGYNTARDKDEVKRQSAVRVISLAEFLRE